VRVEEILRRELTQGWTAKLITAPGGALTQAVTTVPCKMARLLPVGGVTVIPKDDTTALWSGVTNVGLDVTHSPINVASKLNLTFDQAGTCWVIYKQSYPNG
jgi:hypothetical protein